MTRYVALLRAVNVAGRKVPMKELRARFEALGHENVTTYIQSGNVVFDSAAKPPKLAAELEAEIQATFGLRTPVVIRTRPELAEVVRANPYLKTGADVARLYVMFLGDRPATAAVRSLDPERSTPDEFTVVRKEIFIHAPNGVGRSKLTIDWFEQHLGTVATNRNWNTVNQLLDLMVK